MLSESFSHYRIKKKLGAGGMGEVYLAEDLKLERPVALKILPEAFTRDEDRVRRFTGEARAVSRLNHPNIITIYEVGVEDESHYLATEYIEGETLRERINRGSLHLTEIIDIALQINGALGAAHALGIVHRDVKPENVMLRPDGIVKVLDFGLAKINEAPPSDAQQAATVVSRATEPGMILGTVNYMSPEQTRGLPLDPRTDLWSLGVVLYEMATGRLPFHGPTITDTIVSIVNEPPLLPHQLNPIIDESFSAILLKALAKDLSLRYQTAGEMSDELRILRSQLDSGAQAVSAARAEAGARPAQQTHFMSGAPTAPQDYATQIVQTPNTLRRLPLPYAVGALLFLTTLVGLSLYYFSIRRAATLNSVVVLPFVNESSDQQLEYLSDGLTESIINSLSQIPKLRVISRSTAFHYKGRDDFRNIGRDLNVGGILTGRVLKQGDTITVKSELIRAEDLSQVWGKTYELKMASMAMVQDDVATSLGEKLRMTINPDDVERRNSQRRPAAAAYEAYLKGRFYWNKRTAAGLQMSVQYFNDAIAADSQFALPYVGLADTYALLGSYNALPPRTSMPLARKNADAALALDPTLAEALTSRAFVKFYYDWDWAGAEEDFKRALALNPNYVTARQWYADLLAVRGREREGIEQAQLAAAADPLSLAANGGLGVQFYFDRRTDEAIAQLQKTLALEKDFAPAILSLALALARSDQIPEAISLLKDSMNRLGNLPPLQSLLGNLEARAGNATEARRLLRDLTARREAGREYISAYEIAILYAGLGDRDETFAWLDRSAEEKSVYLVFLPVDPLFEAYRADSRYAALLARLRLN